MAQQAQGPPGPPHVGPRAAFGDWIQMDPNQRATASAGWQKDREAVGNYNQQMFERYMQQHQGADQGIPQGPGVGGAPTAAEANAPGLAPPPGGYAPDTGFVPKRVPSLGLGLGLNAQNRAGFQAAAQSGGAAGSAAWLAEHPGVQRRIANTPAGPRGERIQEFMQTGQRPYQENQRKRMR